MLAIEVSKVSTQGVDRGGLSRKGHGQAAGDPVLIDGRHGLNRREGDGPDAEGSDPRREM
jgi:hypothetical protein